MTDSTYIKPLHLVMPLVEAMINMQFGSIDSAIPGLFGDAGIGKTANERTGWNLLDIHYGLKPLEEISGLPDFGKTVLVNNEEIKRTNWTLPDILGDAYKLAENGRPVIIFLDDFHTASPGNMALGYEMFTEKKLRGYPFPPNTAFILAANVSGSKSLANPIPSPIINRIAQFNVSVDFESWKFNFAIQNKINKKILAFLSNPKYQQYFQSEEIVNKPWSSARSWTNFSTLLNATEQYAPQLLETLDIYYLASSFIDNEAALNFSKFYALFKEIDTVAIFNKESEFVLPTDIQKRFVAILACIDEFINLYTKSNVDFTQQIDLINILSDIFIKTAEHNKELAVMGLKEILFLEKSLKLKGLYMKIEKTIFTLNSSLAKSICDDIVNLV